MNLILFYITKSKGIIISFLICMFFVGLFCTLLMSKFKQNQKWKVIFYGLFLQMTNLDILKLSFLIVKSFIVFFAICVTDETTLYISLIIIGLLSGLYVLIYLKRLIHEAICTIIQLASIYFIFLVKNYIKTIDDTVVVKIILVTSIVSLVFFTLYLFFKELDIISSTRAKNIHNECTKKVTKNKKI